MLKYEGLKLKGVLRTDRQTDICNCRVAFATEKWIGEDGSMIDFMIFTEVFFFRLTDRHYIGNSRDAFESEQM